MNQGATLTRRENQIAELIAWGSAKKEIAAYLFISERTVENTARSIYAKTEVSKANELSAWWFCTHFHIPFELSPIRRFVMSSLLLLLIVSSEILTGSTIVRTYRSRRQCETRHRLRLRKENDYHYLTEI